MLSNSDVKKKIKTIVVFHVGFFKNNSIFGASTGEILKKKEASFIYYHIKLFVFEALT